MRFFRRVRRASRSSGGVGCAPLSLSRPLRSFLPGRATAISRMASVTSATTMPLPLPLATTSALATTPLTTAPLATTPLAVTGAALAPLARGLATALTAGLTACLGLATALTGRRASLPFTVGLADLAGREGRLAATRAFEETFTLARAFTVLLPAFALAPARCALAPFFP